MEKILDAPIALCAYAIWEAHGRSHGHDQEHWFRARQDLEGAAPVNSDPARKTHNSVGKSIPATTKTHGSK